MQKLSQITGAIADKNDGILNERALRGIYDRMSSQSFNSGTLAQGAATTTMKIATAINGICGGVPITKAATDDFWGPSTGVTAGFKVLAGTTNVFCMYIDAAGVASGAFGVAGTTVSTTGLGGVKFPPMPEKKMMVGFVIISGGSGDWTAGTSTFTTSTTVTYCTIVNTVGMFDPSATI